MGAKKKRNWIRVFRDDEKFTFLIKNHRISKVLNIQSVSSSLYSLKKEIDFDQFEESVKLIEDEFNKDDGEKMDVPVFDVRSFVDEIERVKIGQMVIIKAENELFERFRVVGHSNINFPILGEGSFLAFRPPFEEIFACGKLSRGHLISIRKGEPPGCNDMVQLLFKTGESADFVALSNNLDCHHTRVLGYVFPTKHYNCGVHNYPEKKNLDRKKWEEKIRKCVKVTNKSVYVVAMDTCIPEDESLVHRMRLWKSWC